jgi:HSP20 family protein
MASQLVEVKKNAPTQQTPTPDVWRSLRTEMDRLFDRFTGGFDFPSIGRTFDVKPATRFESFSMPSPAMDVTEDADAYKVTVELPGLSEKDVEVSVHGDTMSIKGEKKQDKEQKDEQYYMSERSYGMFQRSFVLPDSVDRDKIAADFSKGVLAVTIPKTSEAKVAPKTIEVKASA